MDSRPALRDGELNKILTVLRRRPAFEHVEEQILSDFVRRCEIVELEPYDFIWRESDGDPLDLMIVIDGCVAVWGENYEEDTVDAFITPGQMLGISELFDHDSTISKLETLSNCRLMIADKKVVETFKKSLKAEFYESLCKALLERVRGQLNLLKVRTGQNEKRLAKLFDNFTRDAGWKDLTTIKTRFQKDGFRINLFFNAELLCELLTSQERVIAPAVREFIEDGIIRMYKVDGDFVVEKTPVSAARFPKGSFPDFPYFQFELLDHTELMRRIN